MTPRSWLVESFWSGKRWVRKAPGCGVRRALTVAVDVAEHGRRDVDREDVVGIGEEADTGDETDLDMEPAE